jgi:hypothetical protein
MGAGPLKQMMQTPPPEEQTVEHTPEQAPERAQTPLWAKRLMLAIEIGIALWTGILVLLLPWTRLWAENPLLAAWPAVRVVLNLNFIRGMISGIGVLDIWMGAYDAVHFRDLR